MTLGENNFFMIKTSVIWWKSMWGRHISDQEMTKKLVFCCDRRKSSVYPFKFSVIFPQQALSIKKSFWTDEKLCITGAQRLEFLGAKLCGQGRHETVTEAHDGLLIKTLMMFLQDLSGLTFFWEGVTVFVPSHTKIIENLKL